jgi:hypothetical protein
MKSHLGLQLRTKSLDLAGGVAVRERGKHTTLRIPLADLDARPLVVTTAGPDGSDLIPIREHATWG